MQKKLIGLAVTAIMLTGCDTKDANDYLMIAQEYATDGKCEHAIVQYKNALATDLDNSAARFGLAECYLEQGYSLDAEKELQKVVELGDSSEKVYDALALAYLQIANYEYFLSKYYQTDPNSFDATPVELAATALSVYKVYGVSEAQDFLASLPAAGHPLLFKMASVFSYIKEGSYDKVKSKGILNDTLIPDEIKLELALDLSQMGKDKEALEFVVSSVENKPGMQSLSVFAADRLVRAKQMKRAEPFLDEILNQRPNHPYSNFLKGMILFSENDLDATHKYVTNALAYGLKTDQAYVLHGITSYKLGTYENAYDSLSKVANRLDQFPGTKSIYISTLLKLGYVDRVTELLDDDAHFNRNDLQSQSISQALEFSGVAREKDRFALSTTEPGSTEYESNFLVKLGMSQLQLDEEAGLSALKKAADISDSNSADIVYGYSLFREGQEEEGIAVLEGLVAQQPKNIDPYNLLAAFYLQRERVDDAKAVLQKSLKIDQFNPAWFVFSSGELAKQGKFAEAYQEIINLLDNRPLYFEGYTRALEYASYARKRSDYLLFLDELVKSELGSAQLLSVIARHYVALGNPTGAIEILDAQKQKETKGADYWLTYVSAYLKMNDVSSALEIAELWLSNDSDNPNAWSTKAYLEELSGNLERAVETIDNASSAFSNVSMFKLTKSRLSLKQNKLEQAKREFDAMPNSLQESLLGKALNGRLCFAQGDYECAEVKLLEYFRQKPDLENGMIIFEAIKAQGKQPSSLAFLQQLNGMYPNNLGILMNLAQRYVDTDKSKAIEYFERANEVLPNPVALNNAAWLLYELGELEKALQYASEAKQMAPEDPSVNDTYQQIKQALATK